MTHDLTMQGGATAVLRPIITISRQSFADLLRRHIGPDGPTRVQYQRYLTMQYHLTLDVQRYFMAAAGHREMARLRKLRSFLYNFANEEELHYLVAANDLAELGMEVGPVPFDVILWHTYFSDIVRHRPFVRLGAATILENLGGGEALAEARRALSAPFLTRANSKFLVLHQHEGLPHGDQILSALNEACLADQQLQDLAFGARSGMVLYMRMAEWALNPNALSAQADSSPTISADDKVRVKSVSVSSDQCVSI